MFPITAATIPLIKELQQVKYMAEDIDLSFPLVLAVPLLRRP
jgi:hypothetical protein